jgi:hypothetical protein
MRKRTIHVPDRAYTNAQDGNLPRRGVSVPAEPWDIETELDILGVKVATLPAKDPARREPRPGKLPPDKGKFYRNGEVPEF